MMYVMREGDCPPDDRPWLISTRDMLDVDADDIDARCEQYEKGSTGEPNQPPFPGVEHSTPRDVVAWMDARADWFQENLIHIVWDDAKPRAEKLSPAAVFPQLMLRNTFRDASVQFLLPRKALKTILKFRNKEEEDFFMNSRYLRRHDAPKSAMKDLKSYVKWLEKAKSASEYATGASDWDPPLPHPEKDAYVLVASIEFFDYDEGEVHVFDAFQTLLSSLGVHCGGRLMRPGQMMRHIGHCEYIEHYPMFASPSTHYNFSDEDNEYDRKRISAARWGAIAFIPGFEDVGTLEPEPPADEAREKANPSRTRMHIAVHEHESDDEETDDKIDDNKADEKLTCWLPIMWDIESEEVYAHVSRGEGELTSIKTRVDNGTADSGNLQVAMLEQEFDSISNINLSNPDARLERFKRAYPERAEKVKLTSMERKFCRLLAVTQTLCRLRITNTHNLGNVFNLAERMSTYWKSLLWGDIRKLGLGLPDGSELESSQEALYVFLRRLETKIESYLNFFPPHRTKFKIVPGPKRKRTQKTAQKGNVVA